MNILFLNSLGKSKWGGGEKWMVSAGGGLKGHGHRAIIACLPGSVIEQKAKAKELEIFHFSIPADIAFWKIPPLKSFLKKNDINVLICCQNKDVKIGARAARQVRVKAIFARQGIQNLKNKKKYIIPFTKYIDGIITNTSSIKKIYEGFGWFPNDFIHVVYNGVNLPESPSSIDVHQIYNLDKESKIIFSAGRLDHQKGFDLLIDVAVKAKQQSKNWNILIAGVGKLKKELMASAVRNEVSDIIHFIGFSDQITSLLASADVFVLPSRYEGMPNALLEAMAMSLASVATAVNGAPELVKDGDSGFLVASENVTQLFDKLSELLSNDELRKSMGIKAKLRVKEYFTIPTMIDNLETLFNKQIEISIKRMEKN